MVSTFSMAHGTVPVHDEGRVQDFHRPCVILFINLAMTSSSTLSFDVCQEGGWPPHGTMANHESLLPDRSSNSGRSCHKFTSWKQLVSIKIWSAWGQVGI